MEGYFLFLTFVLVAVASPGPAVFVAIKNSVTYGFGTAMVGILGNITGLFLMATISSLGLGAIIMASSTLFYIIKLVGGLYLIYLGIKLWRSSHNSIAPLRIKKQKVVYINIYKESLFVALSNPKAIAFCTALFPQFIKLDSSFLPQFILLTSTFLIGSLTFLSFYALLASKMQCYLQKQRVMQYFNRITGGIFIGFGSFLASP